MGSGGTTCTRSAIVVANADQYRCSVPVNPSGRYVATVRDALGREAETSAFIALQ